MRCSVICLPRAMTYTNTPRNGRMITKINQAALPQPLRSSLRKMSKMIWNSRTNHRIHKKKISIDQNASNSGKSDEASVIFFSSSALRGQGGGKTLPNHARTPEAGASSLRNDFAAQPGGG